MSLDQHSLVEIPLASLPVLRDSFRVNWPEHVMAYNLIDNLIERFRRKPEHRELLNLLSVDGDIGDSTFIAILQDRDIIIGTLDPQFTKLKIGVRLISFKTQKMLMGFRDVYRDFILELIEEKKLKKLFDDGTTMVHMTREDALKLEIVEPEGFELRGLSPSDAEKVNSVWPHAEPGSVEFIRYCITNNESAGLYEKSTNELVAWCLSHDYHCLLALQVDANHLRKGYGSIVTKAITKKIAENSGADIITNIMHENLKSRKLFEKVGFSDIDANSWIGLIEL